MNAEQLTRRLTEHVADRLEASMSVYIADVAEDMRQIISVPVGYSGSRIIRSLPGEPPRRETGEYLRSWTHRTTRVGDTISASAGTSSVIGGYLEHGTSRMKPRPHAEVIFGRVESEAVDRIKSRL